MQRRRCGPVVQQDGILAPRCKYERDKAHRALERCASRQDHECD